jgi:hypothetical protein
VCHKAGIFGPRVPQGQNGNPVRGTQGQNGNPVRGTQGQNRQTPAVATRTNRRPGPERVLASCLMRPAGGPWPYSVHQSSSLAWPSPVGLAGRGALPFPAGRETGADAATGALSTACLGGAAATAGSMGGI